MDFEFRSSAPPQRAAAPVDLWFDGVPASGTRPGPEPSPPPPRTRLLQDSANRSDDEQVLQVLEGLPPAGTAAAPTYSVALLDPAGEIYREVWLWGFGEALLFTARMNASGFGQIAPPGPAGRYDSVFTRL